MLEHLIDREDRTAWHAPFIEPAHDLVGRVREQRRADDVVHLGFVGDAAGSGQQIGIALCVVEPKRVAEALPERIVADRHIHVAVGGGEGIVRSHDRVGVAELGRHVPGREENLGLVGEQRDLPAEHRDVDVFTFAGSLATVQRGGNGVGGEHARTDIANRDAEFGGGILRATGDAHQSAHALHDQVVSGATGAGATLAESGNRGVYDRRPPFLDRVVPESQPSDRARGEVFDQDVGGIDKPPERFATEVAFQIERERTLVTVDRQVVARLAFNKGRTPPAGVIPFAGLLDFDHIGAEIAEHHGGVRSGHHPRQVDYAQSLQRQIPTFNHQIRSSYEITSFRCNQRPHCSVQRHSNRIATCSYPQRA